MNFLGMGTLEILIVLLIAFIFLGPERMVDAARKIGKVVAEVRRMADDLPSISLDEEENNRSTTTIIRHNDGSSSQASSQTALRDSDKAAEDTPVENDEPVAHQRVNRQKVQAEAEAQSQREQRTDE